MRVIARLDIKGPNLIKGIHLEGLRVLGDPNIFATRYYREGIDELIYIDAVASLYGRNSLLEVVKRTAVDIFVPFAVGGGIRSVDDAHALLAAGADKVAVNTAAVLNPTLLQLLAERFGSQAVVLSIEAKKQAPNSWRVCVENGRQATELDVVEWAKKGVALGAGEILLTSVDNEGTRKGFDVELTRAVSSVVSVPVIASGGMGSIDHGVDVLKRGAADAIAIADMLHYNRVSVGQLRKGLLDAYKAEDDGSF